MFRGRRQLQRRDEASGLAFNWRLPVSTAGSFALAFVIVALGTAALAMAVKVRVGDSRRSEPEQASVILIPRDAGGAWIERRAIEAGPFPARWNPAADPEYAALRGEALREATSEAVPYQPRLSPLEMADESGVIESWRAEPALPLLPEPERMPRVETSKEVRVGARLLDEQRGRRFEHAPLPLAPEAAGDSLGLRFLLEHDARGRVLDVTALSSRGRRPEVLGWLARGQVAEHGGEPGWLVIETVVEP